MSQEQIKQARNIRRRKIQERQAVVFGLLILLLVGVLVASIGMYTGAIPTPFAREFSVKEKPVDKQFPIPCLPKDTLPVEAQKIEVQVLNASDRSGLAAVVSQSLQERDFVVSGTGNATSKRATAAITFGVEGAPQAYTLAAHFNNPALILDDTIEGTAVVLSIGQDFTNLLADSDVDLEPETPMLTREGCTDMWELSTKAPAPEATQDPAPEDQPEEGEEEGQEEQEPPAEG